MSWRHQLMGLAVFALVGVLNSQPERLVAAVPMMFGKVQDQQEAAQQIEFGYQQYIQGQYGQAVQSYQLALKTYRALQDRQNEGRTLTSLGLVYHSLSQYDMAQQVLQTALQIAQLMADRQGEGRALHELGNVQRKFGNYDKAMQLYEQALTISKAAGDRLYEGRILSELGTVSTELAQYAKAMDLQQQALAITRSLSDLLGEGRVLDGIGVIYSYQGEYSKALDYYQQSIQRRREIGDVAGQARTLNNMGVVYDNLGQYAKALDLYQQALAIRQRIGDRAGESNSLGNIALAYVNQGEYATALDFYQQALVIARKIGDRAGEGYLLTSLGATYSYLNNYVKSLAFYEQALALHRETRMLAMEGNTLNSIGAVYDSLGQYQKALSYYQQALTVQRQIGDRSGVGRILSNIGGIYDSLKQYPQALEFYQQSLKIRQEIGDLVGVGTTLNSIGLVYSALDKPIQALELYAKALAIHQETSDRAQQGAVLNNIGAAYEQQKAYSKALEHYQKALVVAQEIGDRSGERLILSNLGSVFAKQDQPELAIAFYKRSVNVTESIRQELRQLSQVEQETYTKTVADTYRALADLLLSQGRLLEAQQVLELLKVQELRRLTREPQKTGQASGILLNANEERILNQHGSLMALGQQLDQCKYKRCAQLGQLNDQLQALTQQYNQMVQTYEKEIRQRRAQDDAFLDPTKLPKLREIVEAQPGTVLIYPLVLKDKIWLVWASKGGIVNGLQIPVSDRLLGEAVLQFREEVQDISVNTKRVKASAKRLYDWLIKPLEAELKTNQIRHLVFSLDRVTRYIPMAALFDGEQYLVEKYTISTVLSADLTNLRDRLPPGTKNTSVLALGASQFSNFAPLPNVPAELDGIVRIKPKDKIGIYPGLEFLNQAFTFRTLRDNLFGHRILHIATHAAFVPGRPEDSYLVLGTNEKLTISQIKNLPDLSNIHLVVLSACETALGGPDQDGIEISGISYYFLNGGASAVLASLWAVNDASTSQLMQQFYTHLAKSTAQTPVTKAEALRQAQLSLLNGTITGKAASHLIASSGKVEQQKTANRTRSPFSHPFYWAPFVLIGNGL